MTTLPIASCIVLLSGISTPDEPFSVFFHGQYTVAEHDYQSRVVLKHELEVDKDKAQWLAREKWWDDSPYEFKRPEGFVVREGIAQFHVGLGEKPLVIRFIRVPSRDAFEEVVRRMAGSAKVSGTDSQRTFRNRFVRYIEEEQLVLMGWSRDIFAMNTDGLFKQARRAEGKHSWFTVRLDQVPKEARLAILQRVRHDLSPKLQRRDSEDPTRADLRKNLGQGYLELIELALSEVTEVTWWYELPTKTKPFRAQVSLQFVPGGKLQQLVRSVSGGRRRLAVQRADRGVVADASVSVRLPGSLQRLLIDLLKVNDDLTDLVSPLIQKDFECHIAITDLGIGKPTALVVGRATRDTQFVPHAGQIDNLPVVESLHYKIDAQQIGDRHAVVAHSCLDDEIVGLVDAADLFQHATDARDRSWLRARIDLSQWTNRLDSSGDLLVALEKLYDLWSHRQLIAKVGTGNPYRVTLPDDDFRSIRPRINDAAMWSAKVVAEPRGNSIIADVEVGRELYDWFVARQILAEVRGRMRR